MRWKLLFIVCLAGGIIAFLLWEIAILFVFAPRGPVAPSHRQILIATFLIPLIVAAFSGLFVYRHTARRRKTQATLSVLLTLLLTAAIYFAGSNLFPQRLRLPGPCKSGPCF